MHLVHDKRMDRRRCRSVVNARRAIRDQGQRRAEQEINSFRLVRVQRDDPGVLHSIATTDHHPNNLVVHPN